MHVDYRLTLRRLTNTLLRNDATYQLMFDAAEELYGLLLNAARMQPDDPKNKTDIYLPEGKAIAPAWAAMCTRDFYRTRQFLRALTSAVRSMLTNRPGRPVHVVYAGTGPFATLALPLTTLFSPEELQFTLLEINPESVRLLRNVLDVFQADAYIRSIELADATTYRMKEPAHIVLTETMQQALQDEPQVAVTRNLAAQLQPGGILIPQEVTISTGLFNVHNLLEINASCSAYRLLVPVFTLSARLQETINGSSFPEEVVDVPERCEEGFSQFCLLTEIHLFDDIFLRTGDSGLTQPKVLFASGPDGKFRPSRIGIQYVMDGKPGFRIRNI